MSGKYSPWLSPDLKALFQTRDRINNAAVKAKSEILMIYTGCPKKKYPDLVDPSNKNTA